MPGTGLGHREVLGPSEHWIGTSRMVSPGVASVLGGRTNVSSAACLVCLLQPATSRVRRGSGTRVGLDHHDIDHNNYDDSALSCAGNPTCTGGVGGGVVGVHQ